MFLIHVQGQKIAANLMHVFLTLCLSYKPAKCGYSSSQKKCRGGIRPLQFVNSNINRTALETFPQLLMREVQYVQCTVSVMKKDVKYLLYEDI